MTILRQVFCTLAELESDLNLQGAERDEKVLPKILAASQLLTQQIGRFLPVTDTIVLGGGRTTYLRCPPFLSDTPTIVHDGTTLSASDVLLRPSGRHWDDGPYSWIEVAPDATNLRVWSADKDAIVITDRFGLYDRADSLGITLGANLTDSGTSMNVSDGGKVSPGMTVILSTEQVFITATGSPTTGVTTISADLDAISDVVSVANGALLKIGEIIRINLEQAKVLDLNGNNAYLARGWNRTQKTSHTNGANVDVYRTFAVERGVNGTTAAAHTSGDAISRQMIPADVNFLTRKIAGRMLLDSQGGFKSRLDDQSGMPTHLYILPHELKEIKRNYYIPRSA